MGTETPAVRLPWLVALFFVSGAVGLAYEVAWSRGLLLLLGSTAGASAVVLGVFVGALGFGARWGGRRVEHHPRPLEFYGVLEIGAAVWAVFSLALLPLAATPYVAIASMLGEAPRLILRLLLATLVVAPAAFLLGATLPAMVRQAVVGANQIGHRTAWLYGLNTVGAVAGCLLTGYYGIAAFGVTGVLLVAGGVGLLVGVLAIALGRRAAERAPEPDAPGSTAPSVVGIALLCGFVGLGIEIAGFRVLVFFVEGFTVTFASMLGVFIAGLGCGSLLLGGPLSRTDHPRRLLGVLLLVEAVVLGAVLLFGVPALEDFVRSVKSSVYRGASSPAEIAAGLRLTSLAGSAALLFVPAFVLGPLFPLCVRWAERQGAAPGEAVGKTYLGNSIGSLLAPLVVTFFVIPNVGVLGAWLSLTVLALLSGLNLLLAPVWRRAGGVVPAVAWVVVAAGAFVVPLAGFDAAATETLLEASVVLHDRPDRTLVDHETDALTTASVIETSDGERILYTDDFAAAATGRYYRYMRMLGYLPGLLAKDPKRCMVIAFGTGTTAGAVARIPGVETIEVVEVSDAVLRLADHFEAANRGVLRDSRVGTPVLDDGRHALLLHEPDLDLITLEPLMPYSPAGLPFYTREFYELAKARLRDGGVLCQWVPVHAMPADLYAAFVRTFFDVFPDGTFWFFEQSTALIGRKGDLQPSPEVIAARVEALRPDLAEAGFEDPWAFASGFVSKGRRVLDSVPMGGERFVGRPVTDSDPYPEFEPTPRAGFNTTYLQDTLGWIGALVDETSVPADQTFWQAMPRPHTRAQTRQALYARWLEASADRFQTFLEHGGSPATSELLTKLLQARDQAAVAYANGPAGDRVLRRRRLGNLRMGAVVRARMFLEAARLDPTRTDLIRQAERLLARVLPPVEQDPEPSATHRAPTAVIHAAAQLWLGRCVGSLQTLVDARDALEADGVPDALASELAAFSEYARAGRVAAPPEDLRWIFQTGTADLPPPCRVESVAVVDSAWRGWVEAGSTGRGFQRAADRLLAAAVREGVQDVVLHELGGGPPADSEGYAPYLALTQLLAGRALGGESDPLRAELVSADAANRIRAARVIVHHKAFAAYDLATVALADDPEPAARRLFIEGAARLPHPYPCLVVDLLMDADVDVRKDAAAALWASAQEILDRYDAEQSAEARAPIVAAVRAHLGCN